MDAQTVPAPLSLILQQSSKEEPASTPSENLPKKRARPLKSPVPDGGEHVLMSADSTSAPADGTRSSGRQRKAILSYQEQLESDGDNRIVPPAEPATPKKKRAPSSSPRKAATPKSKGVKVRTEYTSDPSAVFIEPLVADASSGKMEGFTRNGSGQLLDTSGKLAEMQQRLRDYIKAKEPQMYSESSSSSEVLYLTWLCHLSDIGFIFTTYPQFPDGRPAVTRFQRGIIDGVSWLSDEATSDFKDHQFLGGTWAGSGFEKGIRRTRALVKQRVEEMCEQIEYDIIKGYVEKIRNSETEESDILSRHSPALSDDTTSSSQSGKDWTEKEERIAQAACAWDYDESKKRRLDFETYTYRLGELCSSTLEDPFFDDSDEAWVGHAPYHYYLQYVLRVHLFSLFNVHSETREFHHRIFWCD
ncbi:uncharacterized protein EAF01_008337 [Botrytis porri]|uniref:uncharacterized protein n=1 Tax=Botrytis porri TaxID=87229 RepID=UPI0018FF3A5B|nr:uncharacterized protein EAF01_008337 [Botrytis porri]KAF7899124.1 hypothetical protein EAF01_008337 [Botrytis porri]